MNNMPSAKVGDWCFCEYKLSQIMEMDEGRITEVSDSMFRHSGHDLSDRCFPLSLMNCNISMCFQDMSDKIHSKGSNSLNYPDIHRHLVELWVNACTNADVKEKAQKLIEDGNKFIQEILDKCQSLNHLSVQGIPLFRPRLGDR